MKRTLLREVQAYAEEYFKHSLPSEFHYHNDEHTRQVVANVAEIGEGEGLSEEEIQLGQIAGWFHDLGVALDLQNHEKAGAELAEAYLEEHKLPKEDIKKVKSAILATDLEAQPSSTLEKVVRDADTLHLGQKIFLDRMQALQKELSCRNGHEVAEEESLVESIRFYQDHQFSTRYANENYSEQKKENLRKLIDLALDKGVRISFKGSSKPKETRKIKKSAERGVQTMFRNAYRTHVQLSAIADNKANIMLSINAIIVSIVITSLLPLMSGMPFLLLPICVLITVSLLALVFAVLAVRPSVTNGRFTWKDVENKSANLLFFGNFHKMPMHEFEAGVQTMTRDSDFLYSSMTRDFYYLGLVLAKKYRYLRWCYFIFMYGAILSALSFLIPFFQYYFNE